MKGDSNSVHLPKRPLKGSSFSWIPAFAGMTAGGNLPLSVIPAKAGIQGAGRWGLFRRVAKNGFLTCLLLPAAVVGLGLSGIAFGSGEPTKGEFEGVHKTTVFKRGDNGFHT